MKRRAWTSLGIVLLAGVMLTSACSNSKVNENGAQSETGDADVSSPVPEKDVDLKVLNFRVEDKAFYDEINAKFQEKYPHIHIKYDAVPTKEYEQLKKARMASNDVDVFGSGSAGDVLNSATRETLMDMGDQPWFDTFIPDALKAGQFEGKQLFLPISTVSLVTFYNKKIFSDLGLAVPTTWDEFIQVCEAIKAKGIDPILFGGKDQWPINMVIDELEAGIVRSANPDFYNTMRTEETKFSDPSWVEVFNKLGILSQYFEKNAAGLDYGQAPGMFAQGKAAMMIDGSWSVAQIEDAKPDFEVGAFLLPGSNNAAANQIAITKFGFGWEIYKDSKNKDAALKYLEFLSEPDNYQHYNDTVRMLPVLKDVKVTSPVAQEISKLLGKQMAIWEDIKIPGAKLNYTQYGMQIVLGQLSGDKAAELLQKDLINSKPDWQ